MPFPYTKPLGYVQFVAVSSVVKLGTTVPSTGNTAVPDGATYCVVTVENAAMRWRDDNVDPTPSIGMPVATSFSYQGAIPQLRMIAQSGSATYNVAYYA